MPISAILMMERHSDIRILVTDVEMPGTMDGLRLSHYVRDRWPPVKIIFTSGRVDIREEDMPSDSFFFSKPYMSHHLVGKLREYAIGF